MTVDLDKLSPTGRAWYDRLDVVFREEIGRRLPATLTADHAHAAAFLAVQTAADTMRDLVDSEVAKRVKDDPAAAIAEELYDVAHDGCDGEDGCQGGGRPWYDGPARKLTDPSSGVTAIALAQQMLADRLDDPSPDPGSASWIAGLQSGLSDLCAAGNPDTPGELWQQIAEMGAWCAAWLDAITRGEDEERAAMAAAAKAWVTTDVD